MASDLAHFILSDEDHDYRHLHDVLVEHYFKVREITDENVVAFVKLLPHDLLCDGLKWGFGDTEVRDNCYEWLKDNREKVEGIFV